MEGRGPDNLFSGWKPYATESNIAVSVADHLRDTLRKRGFGDEQLTPTDVLTDEVKKNVRFVCELFNIREEDLPVRQVTFDDPGLLGSLIGVEGFTGSNNPITGENIVSPIAVEPPDLPGAIAHELAHGASDVYRTSTEITDIFQKRNKAQDDPYVSDLVFLDELPALAAEEKRNPFYKDTLPDNEKLIILEDARRDLAGYTSNNNETRTRTYGKEASRCFALYLLEMYGPKAISRLATYGSISEAFQKTYNNDLQELFRDMVSAKGFHRGSVDPDQ
jgi:hypothetical protein